MRDFRDAKAMAQTLRTALAAKGLKITNSESLELIAQALGVRDWNTLSAMIRAETDTAPKDAATPPVVADPAPPPHGQRFSPELEETLHRAVALANQRNHKYASPEHLLLALTDDPDAAAVMSACNVDREKLRSELAAYLATELGSIVDDQGGGTAAPMAGFQRIVQRAVIHVQARGGGWVTGANALVAVFAERESRAAALLLQHGISRDDAVNFIARGVVKGGGSAAA
ncbi:MAG TPA: Clp protease N-terminal domain-containing protein [Caulobacteraceae bacterium]|nr:Clp protease N-terminal domain-containing protein [Caulobacteraceae bacterium]